MPSLNSLFWSFFKVGTFTIGGGFAMIPLMEKELIDRHGWLTHEEFMNQMSISQALPGVFAVNMATGVGYRLRGVKGAVVATVGNIVMPIVIILIVAVVFRQFRNIPLVEHIFMGIRPAVVALIAAPVFRLAKAAKVTWHTVWIPILSALLIWALGVSPMLIILGTLLLGLLYYGVVDCKQSK